MKGITLQQLKADLQNEEAKRAAIIDQGARGFHLGIDQRNNPRKELGERKLWDIGYEKASKAFERVWGRNGGNLR